MLAKGNGTLPTLAEKQAQLSSMSQTEINETHSLNSSPENKLKPVDSSSASEHRVVA